MELQLTDAEVKQAITEWLLKRLAGVAASDMRIRRLYYNEGSGYETVVEMPDATERTLKLYVCPVCAFDKMRGAPRNHEICPQCGTQFDYDDATKSHAELHAEWVAKGSPWFSTAIPKSGND